MQAKKIASQIAQVAKTSDNKRCFDCEQLGTTYYVPQLSVFVCTPCSGVHMQFGHRVKSVTLADYTAHEAEQMQQGGNQVAAYRWLARYTPGKDLGKPTDRNPQKIRGWIQTVFVDKRFFSADAPIPRRSTDSAGSAATAAGVGAITGGGTGSGPPSLSGSSSFSSSFRHSSSAREGHGIPASPAARTSPVGLPSSPSAGRQQHHHVHAHGGSSPPVHDVREILGDKAPALHVVTKGPSESAAPAAPAAPAAAQQPPAVFDPFAAPPQPVSTPALQPVQAAPVAAAAAAAVRPASTGGFDPFQQQQQQVPQQQHPAAPAASAAMPHTAAGGWASFDEAPAFPAAPQPASTGSVAAAAPAVPAAAVSAGMSNGGWADFGGDAFPAATGGTSGGGSAPAAAPVPTAAPASTAAAAAPAAGTPAAPAAAPADSGTGTPKGGKPPAKELAPDLFADFGFGAPAGAAGMVLPQHAAAMQYQQQAAMAAAMGAGMRPPLGGMQQPLGGFGAAAPGQQQPQVPAHLAWQVQQQAALQWQYQQQVQQQQQQQQQQQGVVPGYGMASPRSAAAWGAQPGFGAAAGGFGMPGQMANGMAGGYGMQQQVPTSGPTSTGSGPASGGGSQWTMASATAGVTEQNAFADLVDLKSALPPVSGTVAGLPAASMPQQMQQMPYGQMGGMPGMPAGYGAPSMMQPQYAAAAGAPAYGQGPQAGMMPQQPAAQLMQQQYGAAGAAGFYSQQQQQPAWGVQPQAAPAAAFGLGAAQPSEEGNPFA